VNDENINIILVDDNDIDIVVNTKLLRLANFSGTIESFHSGKEALEYIKENADALNTKTNVLLLDIQMPGVDGFETLAIFETLDESVKNNFIIFMLSSSIDRNDIIRAEANPSIRKVMEKPLDVYLLRKLIGQS
jgi:CheY-like chemotaxis protein